MPVATAANRTPQHLALMQAAWRRPGAGLALLAGRSREIEAQRALPQGVADRLAHAGLYRLRTPQALGGHAALPASFYLVTDQLARADAASAWRCFIRCTASLLATYLPEGSTAALFQRPGRRHPRSGHRHGARGAAAPHRGSQPQRAAGRHLCAERPRHGAGRGGLRRGTAAGRAAAAAGLARSQTVQRSSVTSSTSTPRPRLIETQLRILTKAAPPAVQSAAATQLPNLL